MHKTQQRRLQNCCVPARAVNFLPGDFSSLAARNFHGKLGITVPQQDCDEDLIVVERWEFLWKPDFQADVL